MDTPVFQQLTGLLTYLKAQLRADSYLVTGVADTDMGYDADQVCHTTHEHKLIEPSGDTYIKLVPEFGLTHLPALAIWDAGGETMNVRGSSAGKTHPVGMDLDLGLQYIFLPSPKDVAHSHQFSTRFALTIWWKICEIAINGIRDSASDLRATYHIEDLGVGGHEFLPPAPEGMRVLEADMSMAFKRPPWMTGATSELVTTLADIHTDHNEKGDTGADPLVQSHMEPA